jgi:hypothetical protein
MNAETKPNPETIRMGAPYNNSDFESLCRAHGVWGTAQAALCAVFWRAADALEQARSARDKAPAPVLGCIHAYFDAATINNDFLDYRTQIARMGAAASTRLLSTPPPARGEYWPGQGGRYICTLPALLGVPARHLVVGEQETQDLAFGPTVDVPGAASHLDGPANTAALLVSGQAHPAAKWAAAYTADGHSDFHLPSRLDLVMAHICAPQIFQKSDWYWSSTQGSRYDAFVQDFENGNSLYSGKGLGRRVRAFRWIHLNA